MKFRTAISRVWLITLFVMGAVGCVDPNRNPPPPVTTPVKSVHVGVAGYCELSKIADDRGVALYVLACGSGVAMSR